MENRTDSLYEKINQLQGFLRRRQMQEHFAQGPAGSHCGRGRVLALLRLQPEMVDKDLAYLLGIHRPALDKLLGKLEQDGLVNLEPAEGEPGMSLVVLTEKGRSEPAPAPDPFHCLTPEEQARFGECMDRVIASLKTELGGEADDDWRDWMHGAHERMGEGVYRRPVDPRAGFHAHRGCANMQDLRGCRPGDARFARGFSGCGPWQGSREDDATAPEQ